MTHYLVNGKLNDTSADDSFIYFFQGNYTYEQLEKLALEKVCEDEGLEERNDQGEILIEGDEPARVDIWDILKSDSPITFLTQANKEEN
tara:strand:+ start:2387 stop:2653 length:267 start_codon:yes stop_codon:yes gene_type:complete